MIISQRLHVPVSHYLATQDPPGSPVPLATLAQWTPEPTHSGSSGSFAVAAAKAFKGVPNANSFAVTTKADKNNFTNMTYTYAGQYDGARYEEGGIVYFDYPPIAPLLPIMGCKVQPSVGGDSNRFFAVYNWLGVAGGAYIGYVGSTKLAAQAFNQLGQFAKPENNLPLNAFLLDGLKSIDLLNLLSATTTPEWVGRGTEELGAFNAAGPPLIIILPPLKPGSTSVPQPLRDFINVVTTGLFGKVKWASMYAPNAPERNVMATYIGGGKWIDYFRVTTTGNFVHAEDGLSEPCLTVAQFKSDVLANPAYGNAHVMFESGGDSILVSNALK